MRGSKPKGNFETDGVKYEVRDDGLYKLDTSIKTWVQIPVADQTDGEKFNVNFTEMQSEQKDVTVQINKWTAEILDEEAQTKGYDDIKSVRTYTGYPNIYQKECSELASWSSNTWLVLSKILPKVIDGSILITSKADLKAQLPKAPEQGE